MFNDVDCFFSRITATELEVDVKRGNANEDSTWDALCRCTTKGNLKFSNGCSQMHRITLDYPTESEFPPTWRTARSVRSASVRRRTEYVWGEKRRRWPGGHASRFARDSYFWAPRRRHLGFSSECRRPTAGGRLGASPSPRCHR